MEALINALLSGAISPPPELAGRQDLLDQALLTLARIKNGRSDHLF